MIDLREKKLQPFLLTMEDGDIIELSMLSLKEIKKFNGMSDSIDDSVEVLELILNKNKQGRNFTKEYIENLDTYQIRVIIEGYSNWISNTEKN